MIPVTISYDYELCWGVWDAISPDYARSHVVNANAAALGLVALHRKHGLCSTWAIVGALLEPLDEAPDAALARTIRPDAQKTAFADYAAAFGADRNLFKADETVISVLRDDPLFEPASHTYTHLYMLDSEQSVLENDFALFDTVFQRVFGHRPRSIVFPKNQTTDWAVAAAKQNGFTSIRVNPASWLYEQRPRGKAQRMLVRLLRYADSFVPLLELFGDRSAGRDPALHVGQYFFRPYFPFRFMDTLHFWRLRAGLALCRWRKRPFHVWTHPHNFGKNPERALANADRLFAHLKRGESSGAVEPCRMMDLPQ